MESRPRHVRNAEAQTVLRYAEYSGSEGIRPESLRWFDEQSRARTDGRYAMQIHWAGSLLGARDIYPGVRDGVADMGVASAAYTPQELYASTVADVPEFPVDFYGGTRALLDFLTNDPEAQMFMEDANIVPGARLGADRLHRDIRRVDPRLSPARGGESLS